jgi:hypothetical protein
MHIHMNPLSVQAASFFLAAQGERAAAAQRAAETRKKLLKSASAIGDEASAEETLLIGQWRDGRHSQVLGGDEYRSAGSGKDPDFG